jgi:Protein of unknown function (DUF3309)
LVCGHSLPIAVFLRDAAVRESAYGSPRAASLVHGLPKVFRTPGTAGPHHPEEHSMLGTILLVVLVLMLLGALPTWPHSRSWGYAPSGVFGLLVVVLLILLLTGRI